MSFRIIIIVAVILAILLIRRTEACDQSSAVQPSTEAHKPEKLTAVADLRNETQAKIVVPQAGNSPMAFIDSFEDLQRFSAAVTKEAGTTDERTQGRFHELPRFARLRGMVPGNKAKASDLLDTDWYVFQLLHSWPTTIGKNSESHRVKVHVIVKVYWRDPYIAGSSQIPSPAVASRAIDPRIRKGDVIPGSYFLKVENILNVEELPVRKKISKPQPMPRADKTPGPIGGE